MIGYTLKQAIERIEQSDKTGWKLEPIEGTDRFEISRVLSGEELDILRYERPKKMAQLFIDIIESDIERTYDIYQKDGEIHFTHITEDEKAIDLKIQLRYDNGNFIVMYKGQKAFEGNSAQEIIGFIDFHINQFAKIKKIREEYEKHLSCRN